MGHVQKTKMSHLRVYDREEAPRFVSSIPFSMRDSSKRRTLVYALSSSLATRENDAKIENTILR